MPGAVSPSYDAIQKVNRAILVAKAERRYVLVCGDVLLEDAFAGFTGPFYMRVVKRAGGVLELRLRRPPWWHPRRWMA